jgi:fumarate reductase subunit C
MEFQLFSLRSILNVTASLRQAIARTPWYAKRKSYRVLFWREITPLAVPIFLENTCVLLMGVLSTFLVSWLGKEAMAGVGLADSFNMVVMSFFAAIDLGTTVVVALASASSIPNARGSPPVADDHDCLFDCSGGGDPLFR